MKIFKFEIEVDGISARRKKVVQKRANHLQGAIRQIYQNQPNLIQIVRILD